MKRVEKKWIIIFLMIISSNLLYGLDYYVSSSEGNDSNAGKSAGFAWKSLSKVEEMINSGIVSNGDKILFKRGDVFRGKIEFRYKNDLYFGAYGSGEIPVIKGSVIADGFNQSGNIWSLSESSFPSQSNIQGIYIDGVFQDIGKWPETGFFYISSHSGDNIIYSDNINGTGNSFNDADVILRSHKWRYNKIPVSEHDNNKVVLSSGSDYELIDGFGFYFINDDRCLNSNGNWKYKAGNRELEVYYSGSLNDRTVEVPIHNYGIVINDSEDITIEDISFEHFNNAVIRNMESKNVTVTNCSFKYSNMGICGTGTTGKDNIESSTFDYILGTAIGYVNSDFSVSNCKLTNTGLYTAYVNYDMPKAITQSTGISAFGGINTAKNNTILNTGYIAISCLDTIQHNYIDSYCSVLNDGAAIYGGSYSVVSENIIRNAKDAADGAYSNGGVGIYYDDNTQDEICFNNTIMEAYTGIQINSGSHRVVYNNIFYNCKLRGVYVNGGTGNDTIVDNIIYQRNSKPAFQYSLTFSHSNSYVNNNYYLIPYLTLDSLILCQPDYAWYNFSNWQNSNSYGFDKNSKVLDFRGKQFIDTLFVNESKNEALFTLNPYKDYLSIDNREHNENFILKPFQSKLLFKSTYLKEIDNNPPTANNASVEIEDDIDNNTNVVQVIGSDPDPGQSVNFSIVDGNSDFNFNISNDGLISVVNADLLKSLDNIALIVRVSDNGSPSLHKDCFVDIKINHITDTSELKKKQFVIYIDPHNFSDELQDGTFDHPFASWDRVTWIDDNQYLQKRGTEAIENNISVAANNVTLGAYGEGKDPIIISVTDGYVFKVYNQTNVSFKNLNIYSPNAISSIYFMGESNDENTVEYCKLEGASFGVRIIDGMHFALKYNTFKNDLDGVYFGGSVLDLHYNIFSGNNIGVNITSYNSNVEAFNNVFYNNHRGISSSYASLVMYNNIFYLTNTNDIAVNLEIDNMLSDNNIYYPEQEGFISINNQQYNTLPEYQSSTKQELKSLTLDPLFEDVLDEDFRLAFGSPAVDNGKNVNIFVDVDGNPVPNSDVTDIGAFESDYTKSATTNVNKNKRGNDKLNIFPNPSKGEFSLRLKDFDNEPVYISVMDISGKQVFTKKYYAALSEIEEQINITNQPKGFYQVIVNVGDEVYAEKIVIVD